MTQFLPTVPANLFESVPEPVPPLTSLSQARMSNNLDIKFSGSGSEYFRIWIVNLLLTVVTLTLYLPWARARRLRYFMGNTLVGGQPLGFHGDPRKMFKGYLLVAVFLILYSVAGKFSPTAGFVAFVAVVVLWPALFKSSLQFRLGNTSWRGLRFGFAGSLGGAYRAMVPLFIPGLILLGAQVFGVDAKHPPQWYGIVAGVVVLSALAVSPWLFWNLKQYQHNHYTFGKLQTTFSASIGSFYLLSLKVVGLAILILAVPFGLGFAAVNGGGSRNAAAIFAAVLLPLLGVLLGMVCIKPFAVSRLQNLVWRQTGCTELGFESSLRFRSLLWLTLKNWLLIVLTLGFYWPFALVAMTRLRLEVMNVTSHIAPELLMAEVQASSVEAAGDAAGDFFGMDVGL